MESHYYTVKTDYLESCSLHYLTKGSPDKPVVFCVHGLTCNARDFDFLAETLEDEFYVIAVDMPGRGLSSPLSKADEYHNGNYLLYCMELLDHLGIDAVHWVGASMGGMIGMLACMTQPQRVTSLMLNDVGSVLAKEGLEDIFLYLGKEEDTPDNEAFMAQLKKSYAGFHFTQDWQWEHFIKHRTKKDASGKLHLRYDPVIMESLRKPVQDASQIEDMSLEEIWAPVACPVLLFRGQESLLLREDTAIAMQDDPEKDVTLHQFEHVGHMPNLMETEQLSIIRNWLLVQR